MFLHKLTFKIQSLCSFVLQKLKSTLILIDYMTESVISKYMYDASYFFEFLKTVKNI